ncbi:MAG TPA: PEP-CTERM sorting domain-containing protein [Gemmatirosa sp.]|nr:PEP-CTERM sorting domain-containing protein [Gemmatirosa sp.]
MPPLSRTHPARRAIRVTLAALAALSATALATPAAAQIRGGHVDDFEGGTTAGWGVGAGQPGQAHPAPPVVVGGGRTGAADDFLRITALGANGPFGADGPGSRLSAYNVGSAWQGDYLSAGVTGISFWARNFGASDVFLRLAVVTFPAEPGPPTNAALSQTAVVLSANSGWSFYTLSLAPGALFAPIGTAEGALRNVTELRFYHSAAPGFPPPVFAGVIGLDDITATTVPEPATLALVAGGLALLGVGARRRRG